MGGTDFHSEIIAYCVLTGAEPTPWDVAMLRAIFRIHMAASTKKTGQGERPVSRMSMPVMARQCRDCSEAWGRRSGLRPEVALLPICLSCLFESRSRNSKRGLRRQELVEAFCVVLSGRFTGRVLLDPLIEVVSDDDGIGF